MRLVVILLFFMFSKSASEEDFYSALAKRSKDISSVTAEFVQYKYITSVDETIVSKGVFYYRKVGNVRFDYSSPKVMSIIMNPDKLNIISSGNTTTFSLENQKGLSDLALVMEACMGGNISSIPRTYNVSYQLYSGRHTLTIIPKNKEVLGPYQKIELFLNEADFSLDKMILYERSKDFTTYKFSNLVLNRSLSDKMFLL